jgi:hypothetical protein
METNSRISDPGFAPGDLTDGRPQGDWKTRYTDKQARRAICIEAIYTALLLFACPIMLLLIWLEKCPVCLHLSEDQSQVLCRYAYAWTGGLLGGTLYALKWLYHSVAHWRWNRDRRLWRLLAPHLSAALAFVFVCMVDSDMLVIFEQEAIEKPPALVSIGFLIGYFSDAALAKMSEIAMSLFGTKAKNPNPTKKNLGAHNVNTHE